MTTYMTNLNTAAALDAQLEADVRRMAYKRNAFYLVVLAGALYGAVTGVMERWELPLIVAVAAVGSFELGGVVLMSNAAVRRRLGERAIVSMALSAIVATAAVSVNLVSHADRVLGGIFAGLSALGYLVFLISTEAARRDRLRALGQLPPTTPAYSLWQWAAHPWLTARARELAKADVQLGLYGSLRLAREQVATERQRAAIVAALHKKIRKTVDRDTAELAVLTFDLTEIAERLRTGADYDGLTALLRTDLDPVLVATGRRAGTPAEGRTGEHPVRAIRYTGTASDPQLTEQEKDAIGAYGTPVPALNGAKASVLDDAVISTYGHVNGDHNGKALAARTAATRRAVSARTDSTPRTTRAPRTDEQLLAVLDGLDPDEDGFIAVRRAARELGCGTDRARKLLTQRGLYRNDDTDAVADLATATQGASL